MGEPNTWCECLIWRKLYDFKEILQGAATSKQRKLYEEENKECHENVFYNNLQVHRAFQL